MKRKMISLIFALLLCLNLAGGVYATAETAYVYDDADLLSYEEETALAQKLESYSDTCDAQLVVVTVDRIEGDVDAYTDDLYDRMAFGFGPDRDGVLLLVSMDPRQYRILSNGYAGDIITADDIAVIGGDIRPHLSNGDYDMAFHVFADICVAYLDGGNGDDWPVAGIDRSEAEVPRDLGPQVITALVIGAVVGLIVALVLKAQLKSVRRQNRADAYIRSGSMRITHSSDLYLYRHVTRTRKESGGSRGGGSRGGGSRSMGGGSF